MFNCPYNNIENLDKILQKIEHDSKCRPIGCYNGGRIGPTGPTGPIGPTGSSGTSVTILGSYDTIDELTKEHPIGNIGDGYLIGDDLYIWSNNGDIWNNVGRIRGPKGEPGLQGEPGEHGIEGATGPTGPTVP